MSSTPHFSPVGQPRHLPATRAARYCYRSFVDYAEWNNRNFLVVPLIENPDAVDNIDEICALDQVHVLAFGPGDLAYAIGDGNNMTDSPKIRDAYLKVQAAADRHGVAVMGGPVLDPSVDGCKSALEDGVKVLPRPGCHGIPAVLRAHRAYRRRLGARHRLHAARNPDPRLHSACHWLKSRQPRLKGIPQ